MPNIVYLDSYTANPGDLSWDELQQLGSFTAYDRTAPDEIVPRAIDAEIILTNKVVFSADLMAQLPRLRYIGVTATGYNIVDTDAARARGIIVTNIPAYSTRSVAQQVFALLLAATNAVEHYASENRQGRWSASPDFCYQDAPIMELAGKTLGIYGMGSIGQSVCQIAQALGMHVIAFTSKAQHDLPAGVEKAQSLQSFLAESHVVSLHCPLTPETHHLINANTLSLMRPDAILINTARGPIVDESAVAAALRDHRLSYYCADVMEQEPPAVTNPLISEPRAILTPHIAWASLEARQRLISITAENIRAYLSGAPIHVVNA